MLGGGGGGGVGAPELFPARESVVSDIQAGEGKIANLFYSAGRVWYLYS